MDGFEQMDMVSVIQYDPQYDEAFQSLNLAWIEEFFEVEPLDVHYLNHPKQEIIDRGGMIYFALIDGEAVGTVAMMKMNDERYELSKMAVDSSHQGKGIGKLLMDAVLAWTTEQGAREIQLDTNTKLKRALNLYYHSGFVDLPPEELTTEYTRSDLRMVLKLK